MLLKFGKQKEVLSVKVRTSRIGYGFPPKFPLFGHYHLRRMSQSIIIVRQNPSMVVFSSHLFLYQCGFQFSQHNIINCSVIPFSIKKAKQDYSTGSCNLKTLALNILYFEEPLGRLWLKLLNPGFITVTILCMKYSLSTSILEYGNPLIWLEKKFTNVASSFLNTS